MSKKNIIIRIAAAIILAAFLLPDFFTRISYERMNKNVVFALNYNNAEMVLSPKEFNDNLLDYQKSGINTVLIGEESLNSLISSGYITAIKYNVLLHKYDDESEEIIKQLEGNELIHNDSYLLITKRAESKKFLSDWIAKKYAPDEYVMKTTPLGADVYVLYNDAAYPWQIMIGFNESKIKKAHEAGADIVLATLLGDYTKTDYVKNIENLVKKYNIKYINLKENNYRKNESKAAKNNTEAFARIIEKNNLTLVLTENTDQLSNQKPNGYARLVESARGRVIRSYETTDFNTKNTGATDSTQRYFQILNSVIDRNIRFVSINQLTNGSAQYDVKAEKTLDVTKSVMKKLNSFGYVTNAAPPSFSGYTAHRRIKYAAAGILIILMWLTVIELLAKKTIFKLEMLALLGAVLLTGFTAVAPMGIVLLYPSLFALSAPCFNITMVLLFIKKQAPRVKTWLLCVLTVILTFVLMCIAGVVLCSLLSGYDFYINSLIFRGIKLSLIVPILYTAAVFCFIFGDGKKPFAERVKMALCADIKVYWVIIFAFIALCGAMYIVRSGNVKTISGAESFMRNAITNRMAARPRTKEFLVGWPALLIMVYYIKETDIKLMRWMCGVGASVLFASVMNSFCHVFTGAEIIFTRVINGMLLGLLFGAVIYVLNLVIWHITRYFSKNG